VPCGLTKYGRRELTFASVAAALFYAWFGCLAAFISPWWALAVVPVAAVWGWVLWFFRDPDRTPPAEDGTFISPADGTVADITNIGPDSALGTDGVKIGVFMSIFSVHVNRSPCDGQIRSIEHTDGAFLDVRKPEAAFRNESTTIHMTHTRGGREYTIVVRQVAGFVARRILTDLAVDQCVRRGERIGMIKFGSRLELLVPRELVGEVRVFVGQPAVAGATVLVAAPKEPDRAEL
jgi:phosphatidylserine decarboxylase